MALKRRGNIWWIDLAHPHTGDRIRESTGTSDDTEAQEYHDALKHRLWREGKLGEANFDPITFEVAAERWIKERREGMIGKKAKKSIAGDDEKFAWFCGTEEEPGPLRGVNLDDIGDDLLQAVLFGGQHNRVKYPGRPGRAGRKITNATYNRWMALPRAVLGKAHTKWKHRDNKTPWLRYPITFQQLREPDGRGKLVKKLKLDQLKGLFGAMRPFARDIYMMGLVWGQRRSNYLWLEWSEVDLVNERIAKDGDVMKGGEDHWTPITPLMKEILVRQVGKHPKFVFVGTNGERLNDSPRQDWKKGVAAAGITVPGFRPHDLRHVWATALLAGGASPKLLQALGAWKNSAMVDRYGNPNVDHLRDVASKADDAIAQIGL
jgi:integrase